MAENFEARVRKFAHVLTTGTVLAVDPASGGTSMPGWAAFRAGKLIGSGTVPIKQGQIQERLRTLYDVLLPTDPDVLVIERIRGSRAHEYLHWSVGVAVAACCPVIMIEVPISTWKKHAGKDHVKTDQNDAIAIGTCVMALAKAKGKAA